MATPIARLIAAVAILLAVLPDSANGNATAAKVARPTIQWKNDRGLGVVNASNWARPVATRASTNAVAA